MILLKRERILYIDIFLLKVNFML